MMAVFVYVPTPFIDEFFQKLVALNYPKNKIDLYIFNAVSIITCSTARYKLFVWNKSAFDLCKGTSIHLLIARSSALIGWMDENTEQP